MGPQAVLPGLPLNLPLCFHSPQSTAVSALDCELLDIKHPGLGEWLSCSGKPRESSLFEPGLERGWAGG